METKEQTRDRLLKLMFQCLQMSQQVPAGPERKTFMDIAKHMKAKADQINTEINAHTASMTEAQAHANTQQIYSDLLSRLKVSVKQ
jgi:hypothetical protein